MHSEKPWMNPMNSEQAGVASRSKRTQLHPLSHSIECHSITVHGICGKIEYRIFYGKGRGAGSDKTGRPGLATQWKSSGRFQARAEMSRPKPAINQLFPAIERD